MSTVITFHTTSERLPTVVASLLFLVPGLGSVVFGVLTGLGLTWMDNPANGILLGVTGSIWAGVGFAILRFRRWITVDGKARQVVQGTRTLFRHPAERFSLDAFAHVEVFDQVAAEQRFYVVALIWDPQRRPRRFSQQSGLWLTTTQTVEQARTDADRVAQSTGLSLVDRTRGDSVG